MTRFLAVICIAVASAMTVFAKDRALIVGIEHYRDQIKCNAGMDNLGQGCVTPTFGGVADASAIESLLQTRFGFDRSAIRTLTESAATADNIRDGFRNWLIDGTKSGDRVFFFYSGHGSRIKDDGTDEDDKKDEIIAPFDIQTRPAIKNFIRDDEINEWIALLSGRQVVLIFDSCHSGTVSRSPRRKGEKFSKYLNMEDIPPTRGGLTDVFSDVPKKPLSRDLTTVVDKYMDAKTPNVVVISATQAYQQAMWFDVNGSVCGADLPNAKYRGALTYLFEKIYATENPTLSQLQTELKNGMLKLGKSGTQQLCPAETGYQIPFLEFTSAVANQTLWAMTADAMKPDWEQAAITALQNPLSKIKINLNFAAGNTSYRIGEPINYSVTVSEPAYLYIVVFSRDNIATVVFPYPKSERNFKEKGTYYFDATAQEPLGKDVWVAIASKQKLNDLENLPDDSKFTWEEIYEKIGVNEMQTTIQEIARTRGAGSPSGKLKGSEWQTATAVMTTLPKLLSRRTDLNAETRTK